MAANKLLLRNSDSVKKERFCSLIGILCEKPSAARNFAAALGGKTGSYNGEQYLIVAAHGHLYKFVDPSEMVSPALKERYKNWDIANLPWDAKDFKWKYGKKKDASATLNEIKSKLSGCSEIVIATDVDPTGEGELLAWEILDQLHLAPRKWSRMYFMDEAPRSIQNAFKTRKQIKSMASDMDYVKAFYRSRWDLMSMQFTRIATCLAPNRATLRQGRLKSAMVRIVGDQLELLKNYKKIPFYQNRFKDENGVMYTNPEEPTFPKKTDVPKSYVPSEVVVQSKEMKSSAPPKLLDLAGLSSILSQKGFKASTVLSVYQKMYEAQIVSYPRTEDKVVTPEQFNELLPLVDKIAKVVGVDTRLLTHRQPRKTHVKTGGAHGANRPGTNVPKSLQDLTQYGTCAPLIYEILAKNYLAILGEDYEYELQKGYVKKYPDFKGSCSVPKKLGYKAIFNTGDDDLDDENAKGLGTVASPFVYEGFPPKPATPTMKWLMKQLEKRDVGTGATRTSIYADVTSEKAEYPLLVDKRGKISMTEFGDMSYVLLKGTHIGDLAITERLMSEMRGIAEGKLDPEKCLDNIAKLVADDIVTMRENSRNLNAPPVKETYAGMWHGKNITFKREWGGHKFTDVECEQLLNGEEICIFGLTGSGGSCYNIKGKLAEQSYKNHKFVGFSVVGYVNDDGSDKEQRQVDTDTYAVGKWRGKNIKFKRTWGGHTFTDDEITMLLMGKQISFDAVSKSGKTYTAKGKLASQSFNGVKFVGFKPDFK